MRLAVIIGGHIPFQGALCEASCRRMGLTVFRYANGLPWPGNFRDGKTIPQLLAVRSLPPEFTHVLYTDGGDTLAVAGEGEILQKFAATQCGGVLISGEKNCYPDWPLHKSYPQGTPWKYINAGGWIGTRDAAGACLEWIAASGIVDDQRAWTRGYLTSSIPVMVDEWCQIFQTMNRQFGEFQQAGARLVNAATGSTPCVIHWPGPWHSEAHMELLRPIWPGMITQIDMATATKLVDKFPLGLGAV